MYLFFKSPCIWWVGAYQPFRNWIENGQQPDHLNTFWGTNMQNNRKNEVQLKASLIAKKCVGVTRAQQLARLNFPYHLFWAAYLNGNRSIINSFQRLSQKIQQPWRGLSPILANPWSLWYREIPQGFSWINKM